MQTVRLGRTNQAVSVAGLGCGGASRLGMARGASTEEAARVVRAALDLGITFIDTARAYGTEAAVGLGVQGRRDEVFISSKSGVFGADRTLLSAAALADHVDQALETLRTDRIDLFNLHGVRRTELAYCLEVLVPELQRQQAAGKIRFLGITEQFGGDTRHEMLSQAIPSGLFDVVMVGFNLLNPGARRTVFPLTQRHDVGTLIMFAVRRALSDPQALREAVARLIEAGEAPGAEGLDADNPLKFLAEHPQVASIVEGAYRFCRHEPGADVILTGTGSIEHLKGNVEAILAPPLPGEIVERLERLFGAATSVSGN